MTDFREKYLATRYSVHTSPGFTLQVGIPCDQLRRLMSVWTLPRGCYITAFNPKSQLLSHAENTPLNDLLFEDLKKYSVGLVPLPGTAYGENGWHEHSYLAFGPTLKQARQLARKYQQNAFLWFDENATPELIFTKGSTA